MVTNEILKDLNLPLKDYYICYFDILGYRAFIENNPEEHKKFLFFKIYNRENLYYNEASNIKTV